MSSSPEYIIHQLKLVAKSNKRSEIRLNANGGNSVLIACPPEKEYQLIEALTISMNDDTFELIDLNRVLVLFIEQNRELVIAAFELLKESVTQIFKAPEGEKSPDLFGYILAEISKAYSESKIPILINTGALYGSGIDSIHLMESEVVMTSNKPLIILYPSSQNGDQFLFLNSRPASKYRCIIIE